MELEFDKEIDAILRKGRDGVAVASTVKAGHLDADTIAAFAENALPDKAKLLYVEHFADCDRCRKQLSHAILMNNEADAAAASTVSAPVAEAAVPWYQSIFRTPNLALAMGALVLAFSGFLGYLALQNGTPNVDVALVTEPEAARGGPYSSSESANAPASASNATAVSNSAATNTAANTSSSNTASNETGGLFARIGTGAGTGAAANKACVDCGSPADEEKPKEKPVTAVPPPPVGGVMTERDKKEAVTDKETTAQKDDGLAMKKQAETRRGDRDAPAAPSKTGPSRSGPLQSQSNQVNSNIADMAVSRLVGGKRFENKNGAWYDSAYGGQATVNVRRGTDEFKKLDGGLRSIANTLGGTIVVVWKAKAYRIQ